MLVIDEIFKKSEESTAVCSRIAIMIIQKKKTKNKEQYKQTDRREKNRPRNTKKKILNFERGFL